MTGDSSSTQQVLGASTACTFCGWIYAVTHNCIFLTLLLLLVLAGLIILAARLYRFLVTRKKKNKKK